MATPKFNFIPEMQLKAEPSANTVFRVTLSKIGQLSFSKEYVDVFELVGKLIRIYADREKHVIGWQVIEHTQSTDELNGLRLLSKNGSGSVQVSIGRLLNSIDYKMKETQNKIPVMTYVSPLHAGYIHYIQLK